jgi:SNF2 family DNA or RNA helicase
LSRHFPPLFPPLAPVALSQVSQLSPLFPMATSYERRLLAAADLVLSADAQGQGICLPDLGVTADLKPHQLDGVAWLIRRYRLGVNVVLGDEMGLGKTLQAISLLSHLKIQRIAPGPFLVLCPLSVTDGWLSEFSKFCPSLRLLHYVGDKVHRRDLRRTLYDHVHKASTSSHSNVCYSVTEYFILGLIINRCACIPSIFVTSFFFLHVTGIII